MKKILLTAVAATILCSFSVNAETIQGRVKDPLPIICKSCRNG